MSAYYNEFDEQAAAWLRELIKRGLIAPGEVDTRSIVDVRPDDLRGFTQCHFFAGIGVWSYALRLAGWRDDRPVWTGSPPCQPFSAAGKGLGTADERHLWPAFFHLIDVCRPDTFFGEQVASKDALAWLDHVSADVEGAGYAFGAFDLCAAGFGSPHIRQRLKFVGTRALAHPVRPRLEGHGWNGDDRREPGRIRAVQGGSVAALGAAGGLSLPDDAFWRANLSRGDVDDRADAGRSEGAGDARTGLAVGGLADASDGDRRGRECREEEGTGSHEVGRRGSASGSDDGRMADDTSGGRGEERPHGRGLASGDRTQGFPAGFVDGGSGERLADSGRVGAQRQPGDSPQAHGVSQSVGENIGSDVSARGRPHHDRLGVLRSDGLSGDGARPGPTNGLWGDADWLLCRDGKWRPVEPGTFPLAHGAPARVGRLRGYGNAIVAPAAAHFVASYLDAEADAFDPVDLGSARLIDLEDLLA